MRQLIYIIIIISLSSRFIDCQNFQNEIKGRVINAESSEPLFNCNIYLSGTQWGTSSNVNGEYRFGSVVPSKYELVFSMIGYEQDIQIIDLIRDSTIVIDVKLYPKDYELENIVVKSEFPEDWEANLRKFKKYFLGNTDFAGECEIENEFYINFLRPETNVLKAYSTQPIIVKNYALGFEIICDLRRFELYEDINKVQYLISTSFIDMITTYQRIKDKWRVNRISAYRGSIDHFLFSLIKSNMHKDGFEISYSLIPKIKGDNFYRRSVLNSDQLLSNSHFNGNIELSFNHFLQIKYGYSDSKVVPVSWLKLLSNKVTIDRYGVPIEIMPFEIYGYWANSGISNMLPKYYFVFDNDFYNN